MPHAMAATCEAGSLDLDLVSAIGTGAATHPFAKCFNSMTVSVSSGCTITLTAKGQRSYIPALWSADDTYNQVKECPTSSSLAFADPTAATATTGLASLLATSIYAEGVTASVTASTGEITIVSTYLSNEATLKYRSTGTTGAATGIFNIVGAPSCDTGAECAATDTGCGPGLYSVLIQGQSTYICAVCASGSYSASGATICTKCIAGTTLSSVGATSNTCSACAAGTFAALGSSDCRPCAPGTYQDSPSSSECVVCPTPWSSYTYGATQCVKCTNGRPAACTGVACSSDITAGSGGSFVATVANDNTWTTASSWPLAYVYPALLGTCSPANTILSFKVTATCTMEIRALAQTATTANGLMCSDPSNIASSVTAHYVGTNTIMTLLPDIETKGNILKIVKKVAITVTMTVAAASRYPIATTATVTGDLTVNGGTLVGTDVYATCPAGTYFTGTTDADLSCPACEPGFYCPADSTSSTLPTECAVGTYSSILGQSSCDSCPDSTYAPSEGSSQCLTCASPDVVGSSGATCVSTECEADKTFNYDTVVCDCAPGYYASGDGACTICPANTYSSGGPTDTVVASCTACPTGQVSDAGSSSCSYCPDGQVKIGEVCGRCSAGQEARIVSPRTYATCEACPFGYYNPAGTDGGQFDMCQRCEDGKKTDAGKTLCINCAPGTFSIWNTLSDRVPANDPTLCAACSAGGYSASGASKCILCAGGAQATPNRDSCVRCTAGTYRIFSSAEGCQACPAGTAAGAGSDTCLNCRPGQFSAAGAGTCSSCAVNTYSTDPGSTTCMECRPGTSTVGESGASQCAACPVGTFFNATSKACDECAMGYYQNREGQITCKTCPIGTFSDAEGSSTCELCPPGKYQSVAGSQTCRTCPGGTFSFGGKGSCSICPRGRYSAPGSTTCTTCAAGYYANKLISRSCTACPAGSRCPGAGNTDPTLCAAGSFQSKPAQTICIPCPRKTFSDKAGASRCAPCPTANTVGSKVCNARRRMLFGRFGIL
ncbi:hypothetical protein Ndes2526A_g06790 [Nannochloris sp. 'desiccata']